MVVAPTGAAVVVIGADAMEPVLAFRDLIGGGAATGFGNILEDGVKARSEAGVGTLGGELPVGGRPVASLGARRGFGGDIAVGFAVGFTLTGSGGAIWRLTALAGRPLVTARAGRPLVERFRVDRGMDLGGGASRPPSWTPPELDIGRCAEVGRDGTGAVLRNKSGKLCCGPRRSRTRRSTVTVGFPYSSVYTVVWASTDPLTAITTETQNTKPTAVDFRRLGRKTFLFIVALSENDGQSCDLPRN